MATVEVTRSLPLDGGRPRAQLGEVQRVRLLAAAVQELDARGYAGTTVSHITGRARISRRTFYELFADREACLVAVLDEVLVTVQTELRAAGLVGRPWRERIRGGLAAILGFFDREPALARVCLLHAPAAGSAVQGWRERVLGRLIDVVEEAHLGGPRAAALGCSRLTAEGVVGAALAIVSGRLARGEGGELRALTSELTATIVLPYEGAAVARREQRRPTPAPLPAGAPVETGSGVVDPLAGVSMRLTNRTMQILQGARECSGASNRELSDLAGIQDPGQVSKLLARLQRLGLLVNHGLGHSKGEPNAWSLTAKGEQVVQSLTTPAAGSWWHSHLADFPQGSPNSRSRSAVRVPVPNETKESTAHEVSDTNSARGADHDRA